MKKIIKTDDVLWDDVVGKVTLTYYENYGFDEAVNAGIIAPDSKMGKDNRHVCYYNDKCFVEDNRAYYSFDLTDVALLWYAREHIDKDSKDLSVTFTEVWYEAIDGKYVESVKRQTTYSDNVIRSRYLREPQVVRMSKVPEPIDYLPF